MVTMAQRLETLRTEKGMSRPGLSAALGFPKNAMEKFETGRQTPTREQQEKLANYFGVNLAYLRCESDDPTCQQTWIDRAYMEEEPVSAPAPRRVSKPAPQSHGGSQEQGSLFDSLIRSQSFQDMVRSAVLDVLRSPEGQEILSRTVRKELDRQR